MREEGTQSAAREHATSNADPLRPDEVHLWVIDLDDHTRVPDPHALTSHEERERAARLRKPGDAHRFLVAHAMLRRILGECLKRDPLELRFEAGPRGKPAIVDAPLHFSFSRSDARALVAVAAGRRVGVDVERLRPLPDLDGVAARVSTARELALLANMPAEQRNDAFLAMWTRKEALVKMTGDGLGAIGQDACLDGRADCRLEQVETISGYAACVAAEGTDWHLVHRS